MDEFLDAAIAEAQAGLAEGGIPIGSVLVHEGRIIGRGHNRRVQRGRTTAVMSHARRDGRRRVPTPGACTEQMGSSDATAGAAE